MTERRRKGAILSRGGEAARRRHRPDYWLVVIMAVLLAVGLIVIYSISPGLSAHRDVSASYFVTKQLISIGLGLVAFGVMAYVPINTWRRLHWGLLAFAAIATLAALIMPPPADYPAHRWVHLGSLSFQSSELLKLVIVLVLSAFLAERIRHGELGNAQKSFRPIMIALAVIGFTTVVLQSDLGSAGVMVVMVGAMSMMAGLPMKRLLLLGSVVLIAAAFFIMATPYRRDRLVTFMNPERDCQVAGYQACQALIAVGSGGVFGKGVGHSIQAYGYLPEAQNDSIFAIYAEKFGFLGVTVILGLFLAFFIRIKGIIERAPDEYTRLIAVGVLAWLSTQTIINIGAMMGVLPLKGITLPFISYGGTSIVFVTAATGLLFNISRYTTRSMSIGNTKEGGGHGDSIDGRRFGRSHNTYSRSRS